MQMHTSFVIFFPYNPPLRALSKCSISVQRLLASLRALGGVGVGSGRGGSVREKNITTQVVSKLCSQYFWKPFSEPFIPLETTARHILRTRLRTFFESHLESFFTFLEAHCHTTPLVSALPMSLIRADFRAGDEDSNFSVFRLRRFSEWPEPLH